MKRGKVKPGNKTMLDPLYEAKLAVDRAMEQGFPSSKKTCALAISCWLTAPSASNPFVQSPAAAPSAALRDGADKGMRATADMPACKGRACYRPDKGVGHLDPGAVTMEYQLRTFADKLLEEESE